MHSFYEGTALYPPWEKTGNPGGSPVSGENPSGSDHGGADRVLSEIRSDGFRRDRTLPASGGGSLCASPSLEEEYIVKHCGEYGILYGTFTGDGVREFDDSCNLV